MVRYLRVFLVGILTVWWGVAAPASSFPPWGIIHNSLIQSQQTIMIGVNPTGNLNTPNGAGTTATNSLNVNISQANSGSVGISYYWPGAKKVGTTGTYAKGWYDSTSQGKKWESWGAGALDNRGAQAWGSASIESAGVVNMTVKSFVVDPTSIKSTVWINDTSGNPMLEVTHLYGPTSGDTNQNLFQGLVTITNISNDTLQDVRYRRMMDWDILENVLDPSVDAVGVKASYNSSTNPKIWSYCDNGGESISAPYTQANPFIACKPWNNASLNQDYVGQTGGASAQYGTGSSFDFQFGKLPCNSSVTFYIYYGAAGSRTALSNPNDPQNPGAMERVGATVYSMAYDPNYPTLAYAFGFKGISGTAIAPVLPTKITSLPAGNQTDPTVWQTYAAPAIANSMLYQALFKYQANKQWIGEIKGYSLDSAGNLTSAPPIAAASLLMTRAAKNGPYSNGGRSIWTVGFDPNCMAGSVSLGADLNNFTTANSTLLEQLLFNCPSSSSPAITNSLINFVRGLNSDLEDTALSTTPRVSVLGDTYHSEMVAVGVPNAPWSSDASMFGRSEAYFRYTKGYASFVESNAARRTQIYVGANDGMLHAFDTGLNERWAFIPPPVMPMLRNMMSATGATAGTGTSNSIFSVDGPITVKDVYFYKEGVWKTVLMGGLGWGGNGYYALDITNPDAPKHLFSINNDVANKVVNYWDAAGQKSTFAYSQSCTNFDYSKLGGAWSRPVIMLLPYNAGATSQRWVAVFGGGFAGGASSTGQTSASSFGSYVYTLEFEPDSMQTTASCGAQGSMVLGSTGGHVLNLTQVGSDTSSDIPNGVTADLTVVTGDGTSIANYYGGIVYFTDLQGKLWKMNLTKSVLTADNATLFGLKQMFGSQGTLANDRMGYNQLGTTIVSGQIASLNVSRLFNYFGTGDKTRLQREVSTINNRIYGVADPDFPGSGVSAPNQTVANGFTNVDNSSNTCTVSNSWYANVGAKTGVTPDYEKIIGRAGVYNNMVYFTAYQPDVTSCPCYGKSYLIEVGPSCTVGNTTGYLGYGMATEPVIDAKGNIYVGVSNIPPGQSLPSGRDNVAKLTSSAAMPGGKIQFKSWREKRAH